ncbi:hypothetical protein E4T56_gene19350 [Termitomyces sp. T112]|nr:hypothetical protein E4T56_gene19350 [Termitomyces sp. T112]
MAPSVLLSRTLDPFLGIFTGFFAYYLHETHPRTALLPEERLFALLQWKWAQQQESRMKNLRSLNDTA